VSENELLELSPETQKQLNKWGKSISGANVVLNKIRIREIDEVISELHFMCQIGFNSKKVSLGA
jgi:hypothetical protein